MRIFAAMCVLVLFVGCSKPVQNYGNFAEVKSDELVQDTLFVMFETYPPAQTRLALVQDAGDEFGTKLVEALRLHGYAVVDYVESTKGKWGGKQVQKPDGLAFAYVLDRTDAENEVRVNLHVGAESLSRLYEIKVEGEEVKYIPKGFWSHRQGRNGEDEPAT
jgi:Conjugal transfer protein TrbH.